MFTYHPVELRILPIRTPILPHTILIMSNPTTSFLKVSGDKIVKSDDPSETPVLLRGAGLGGWMNMENVSGWTVLSVVDRRCMWG